MLPNFVSVITITEVFEIINKDTSCSIFERRLFMLRCPKRGQLLLNIFDAGLIFGNVYLQILISEDVVA